MRVAARASAPGTVANFGPGLDIFGGAVTGLRDCVEARWGDDVRAVIIEESGHADLSCDANRNAAGIAALAVLRRAAPRLRSAPRSITLRVSKQLPLSAGQGGSAASAVAGALATNALLSEPLTRTEVMLAALDAESQVAGRHLDNIAPALLGGICLVRGVDPIDVLKLPTPSALRIVLVLPNQRMRTRDARSALPADVTRAVAIAQAADVGTIVHALQSGDLELLGRAVHGDRIAEPMRTRLLPGFAAAKRAAIDAGALGCSISGSGPTAFALVRGDGERVMAAMCDAYRSEGMAALGRLTSIDECGATVEVE
jgi:homoserine kinase